jgi:probable addiction module antidote protein
MKRRTMAKAKTRTTRWDAAEHLKTDRDAIAYLEAALEAGDSALVAAALGDIARARGMTAIARRTGLGRESLYKALSDGGNPELETVLRVVRALGIRLHAVPTAAMPIEFYSPARKADFLLANAVDSKDRKTAVQEIRHPGTGSSPRRTGRRKER